MQEEIKIATSENGVNLLHASTDKQIKSFGWDKIESFDHVSDGDNLDIFTFTVEDMGKFSVECDDHLIFSGAFKAGKDNKERQVSPVVTLRRIPPKAERERRKASPLVQARRIEARTQASDEQRREESKLRAVTALEGDSPTSVVDPTILDHPDVLEDWQFHPDEFDHGILIKNAHYTGKLKQLAYSDKGMPIAPVLKMVKTPSVRKGSRHTDLKGVIETSGGVRYVLGSAKQNPKNKQIATSNISNYFLGQPIDTGKVTGFVVAITAKTPGATSGAGVLDVGKEKPLLGSVDLSKVETVIAKTSAEAYKQERDAATANKPHCSWDTQLDHFEGGGEGGGVEEADGEEKKRQKKDKKDKKYKHKAKNAAETLKAVAKTKKGESDVESGGETDEEHVSKHKHKHKKKHKNKKKGRGSKLEDDEDDEPASPSGYDSYEDVAKKEERKKKEEKGGKKEGGEGEKEEEKKGRRSKCDAENHKMKRESLQVKEGISEEEEEEEEEEEDGGGGEFNTQAFFDLCGTEVTDSSDDEDEAKRKRKAKKKAKKAKKATKKAARHSQEKAESEGGDTDNSKFYQDDGSPLKMYLDDPIAVRRKSAANYMMLRHRGDKSKLPPGQRSTNYTRRNWRDGLPVPNTFLPLIQMQVSCRALRMPDKCVLKEPTFDADHGETYHIMVHRGKKAPFEKQITLDRIKRMRLCLDKHDLANSFTFPPEKDKKAKDKHALRRMAMIQEFLNDLIDKGRHAKMSQISGETLNEMLFEDEDSGMLEVNMTELQHLAKREAKQKGVVDRQLAILKEVTALKEENLKKIKSSGAGEVPVEEAEIPEESGNIYKNLEPTLSLRPLRKELKKLNNTMTRYQSKTNSLRFSTKTTAEQEKEAERDDTKCMICFAYFSKNNDLRVAPCGHIFHAKCMDPWLFSGKNHCPSCLLEMIPVKDDVSDDES
jgi:hypothetical protein